MVGIRMARTALTALVVLGAAGGAAMVGAGPAGATGTVATALTIRVDGVKGPSATTTSPTSTVRVSGLPARATGTVEIDQAGSPWCTITLPVHSCTTGTLVPGSYPTITGTYSGDATYLGAVSADTIDLTVLASGGSMTTCAKMSGHVTTKIAFTFCQVAQGGAYLPGADSLTGGALRWKVSSTLTTFAGSATSPGQGACSTGHVEEDFTGTVTADTSSLVAVGGTVTYRYCQSPSGVVKLVPGTKATF